MARNKEARAPSLRFRLNPALPPGVLLPTTHLAPTEACCIPKAAGDSLLQTCLKESSADFICCEICFQFSLRADSAGRVPQAPAGRGGGLPGTAVQRENSRSEGADSPGSEVRTAAAQALRSHLSSRGGPMCLHIREPGVVSCRMPASWIYSDTGSANLSPRNLIDSKNDKVEFIRDSCVSAGRLQLYKQLHFQCQLKMGSCFKGVERNI